MTDPLLLALIYVSRHYGVANTPDALIADLPLPDGQLTPFLLPRAAEKAGLEAKEEKLAVDKLPPMLLPAILLLKGNSACVVVSINHEKQQLAILSPQFDSEERWLSFSEFNDSYTGHLFLLKKRFRYDERSPELLKPTQGHWFWGTLWLSRNIYRDVFIASILINLFAIATPLFTRLVYDKIVPNQAFDSLWVLASGITLIFGFDFVLKLMRSYFIDVAGKKSDILISAKLFAKVMGLRMEARPPSVGALARHLQEFEAIREFFTSATISSLIDLPFALLFLVVIWLIAGPLVIIPIIALALLILYSLLVQRPLRRSIEEGSRLSSQKHANLIESLSGLDTIKRFEAQSQFQYKWEEAVAHMANWSIKSRRLTDSVQNTAGFCQQFVTVGMIVFGVYQIAAGELTMGGLIAVSMLSSRAVGPLVQLALLSTRYHQAKSAKTIVEQLMALPVEQEADKRFLHRASLQGRIQFSQVSFQYPGQQRMAIKDLDLTIEPGEKVAVIGRVGAGKTTIERLIMGLYKPSAGSISLDNTDIGQLHPTDIRRNIGSVPQDLMLFYGSVRDNIALGRSQVSDDAILRAADRAGVTAFTRQDEAGLDRQVGEGGQALSGGQKQAIAIARALLTEPKVLVMDEPSSSMDNKAEQALKQVLNRLDNDETLILFTHKTSMLDVVDRILVLEQGQLVADGPKEQVLQQLRDGKLNGGKMGTG
ncbi:type I secretion system permease/ATPase [Photobacterium sp. WH77]|uniref:type I secretion system permease/ATPase n=1 Tax=unclassified Photobacterium TaxID=2628852 RepID=UPI001EDC6DC3|nr:MULTISPECIES: type I secretion system permease/ATPase [unclassified Photobacterium]MCG2838980.1 type I secretion system permease/ATPase [Photobacterium sp. WH77]MCG2846597.1 type I secretion system permease/ATPase [Photobacterium sp. WH80]